MRNMSSKLSHPTIIKLDSWRVAVGAGMVAVLLSACTDTVPVDELDTTPPRVTIDFFDFPDQGPTRTASPESPLSYSSLPPSRLRAQIDRRYSVIAKLSDPESGIEFFEIREGKPFAECWVPGSTTQRSKLMQPRLPGGVSTNGQVPSSTSPATPKASPVTWPTERLVSLKIDTNVDESCAAGEEVRWNITLLYDGINGVGAVPRDITVAPNGFWDITTTLRIQYPEPPP